MNQKVNPLIAMIPLASLVALIIVVVNLFPDDALAGASQVALMIATAVCVALGMGIYKMKWSIFEEMIKKTVGDAGVSILILLLIGMMSATWMISGVVPTLIYYGVQIMSPLFFLPCACIISSIISIMTGTSWTTIATIGIALMGIGSALGIPAPYTAGAIISGAYFGDKLSPMSDTTVLASSISGADLFSHIRYMLYTTVPSITLSILLYLFIGLSYDGKEVEVAQYLTGLEHGFHISLWTLLVPVFTGYLIYRKTPSLITLLLSALSACVCALILQPEVLVKIAGETTASAKSLFEGIMITCYTKTQVDTGSAPHQRLGCHTRHGRYARYHLAHPLRHVFRLLHGGEQHAPRHHPRSPEEHPQHRVARLLHRDIGRIAQLGDGRPIPQHHHERLHLQGGICGTWLSTRVAEP